MNIKIFLGCVLHSSGRSSLSIMYIFFHYLQVTPHLELEVDWEKLFLHHLASFLSWRVRLCPKHRNIQSNIENSTTVGVQSE